MKAILFVLLVLGLMTTAQAKRPVPVYQPTGEVKSCLNVSQFDSTRVLDDQTIIFKLKNRKLYRNTLPHSCPRLGFHEAFSYEVSGSSLCDVDVIRVFEPHFQGVTCGLGKFEEVKQVKAAG